MHSENYWESVALARKKQVKAARGRVKEITASRDLWKAKYLKAKKAQTELEHQINFIKKKLTEIQVI